MRRSSERKWDTLYKSVQHCSTLLRLSVFNIGFSSVFFMLTSVVIQTGLICITGLFNRTIFIGFTSWYFNTGGGKRSLKQPSFCMFDVLEQLHRWPSSIPICSSNWRRIWNSRTLPTLMRFSNAPKSVFNSFSYCSSKRLVALQLWTGWQSLPTQSRWPRLIFGQEWKPREFAAVVWGRSQPGSPLLSSSWTRDSPPQVHFLPFHKNCLATRTLVV